jgi:hypothetical protein
MIKRVYGVDRQIVRTISKEGLRRRDFRATFDEEIPRYERYSLIRTRLAVVRGRVKG